jgi:hypothetical protein
MGTEKEMPVRKIVVVGGGSAGWITAGLIAASHARIPESPIEVTLVESPHVGTIGVGEGHEMVEQEGDQGGEHDPGGRREHGRDPGQQDQRRHQGVVGACGEQSGDCEQEKALHAGGCLAKTPA